MFCMFRKCLILAYNIAWNYILFHGVMLPSVLIILALEYFIETSLSLVSGYFSNLQHDVSSCLLTCFSLDVM